jgi:hypothetical protein
MEDVPDVSRRTCDLQRPVACLDEQPTQLFGETCVPETAQPGQVPRCDHECERHGTVNDFMIIPGLDLELSPLAE